MWDKVQVVLSRKIKKKGFSSTLLASSVCYAAMTVGEGLYRPVSFQNGTLTVSVEDSSAASSIQLSLAQTIEKINQKLGHKAVEKIKIKIA